jgi:hypothetical protein
LKKSKKSKNADDLTKVIATFPKILEYVQKSDDMFLLLHGTTTLKTFIHQGHVEILKIV